MLGFAGCFKSSCPRGCWPVLPCVNGWFGSVRDKQKCLLRGRPRFSLFTANTNNTLNCGPHAVLKGVWAPAMQWILVTVAASLLSWLLRRVLFSCSVSWFPALITSQAACIWLFCFQCHSPFPLSVSPLFLILATAHGQLWSVKLLKSLLGEWHELLLLHSVHCIAVLPWSPSWEFSAHQWSSLHSATEFSQRRNDFKLTAGLFS